MSKSSPTLNDDVIVQVGIDGISRHHHISEVEYSFVTSSKSIAAAYNVTSLNDTNWHCDDVTNCMSGNTVVKAVVLVTIMSSAVVGNLLVVVSVLRYDRLRRVANSFVVSLAFADLLVALLVMPFNASQIIAGRWVFNRLTCDMFNANDVLFSTSSLLHLCCISMDRYIAVTDPFGYERRMTRQRAGITLFIVWTASTCLSHIPIHLGLYTTDTQRDRLAADAEECSFKVNRVYGLISSTVSFWTPAVVMIFTYVKIYREARRQEQQIAALAKSLPPPAAPPCSPRLPARNSRLMSSVADLIGLSSSDSSTPTHCGNGLNLRSTSTSIGLRPPGECVGGRRVSCEVDGQRQRLTNERRMMKREHKAAKTLGIIMGAFLICWLPFFTWYLTESLCGDACPELLPDWGVNILFWIGYTNSALNPVIYPCFNRDFREAFRRLLSCNNKMNNRTTTSGMAVVTSSDSYSLQYQPPRMEYWTSRCLGSCGCLATSTGCHSDTISETTRLKTESVVLGQHQTAIPMIVLND